MAVAKPLAEHLEPDEEHGATAISVCDWVFDECSRSKATKLDDGGRHVHFHERNCLGTAVVRGDTAMTEGIHTWCIKLESFGLDPNVAVGVCTEHFNVSGGFMRFCGALNLGMDETSWCIFANGHVAHNSNEVVTQWSHCAAPTAACSSTPISEYNDAMRFGTGSVVLLCLDLLYGCLSIRVDGGEEIMAVRKLWDGGRKPSGLFPLLGSTTPGSKARLLWSRKHSQVTLKQLCHKTILKSLKAQRGISRLPLPDYERKALDCLWLRYFDTT